MVRGRLDKLASPYVRFVLAMGVNLVIGCSMLMLGLGLLQEARESSKYSVPVLVFVSLSILFFLDCIWAWTRFLGGTVLYKTNEVVALENGQLSIPEFPGKCELWLFIGGSFRQYHGEICVNTSGGQTCGVKLRRLIPLLHSLRRSFGAVALRLRDQKLKEHAMSCLCFRLEPSFAGTGYDHRSRKDNIENVTIIIRAI